jgi:hypothetical protein
MRSSGRACGRLGYASPRNPNRPPSARPGSGKRPTRLREDPRCQLSAWSPTGLRETQAAPGESMGPDPFQATQVPGECQVRALVPPLPPPRAQPRSPGRASPPRAASGPEPHPGPPGPQPGPTPQLTGVDASDTSSPAATSADPITVDARGPRRRAEPGCGGGGRMSATPRATRGSRKAAARARGSQSSRSSSRPLATVSTRPWSPTSTPAGRPRSRRRTHRRAPTRASMPGASRRKTGQGTRWHQTAYVSPEREPHTSPHRNPQ